MLEPFVYRARLVRVVDGDTLDVVLDAGFGIQFGLDPHLPMRLRLLGVNAREMHAKDPAVRAQAQADKLLTETWFNQHAVGAQAARGDWPLLIQTSRDDAFGRYLALVYGPPDPISLSDALLGQGIPTYSG